ncbi:hypothetical protein SGRIM128S_05236 [Streptomyces griseomycini]
MKSWKRAVKGVCRACARSTCASPSTARRTSVPRRASPSKCARSAVSTASGHCAGARCEAPGISTSAAPGTASAICRRCPGGVAGSSRPATSRVGASISASRSRRSNAASASQHAAYASGSASRWSRTSRGTVNPGVNHRASAPFASPASPSRRTSAARSSHGRAPLKCAEEQITASDDTRSGWCTARCSPTAPPSETPAYPNRSMPSASASASTSSARSPTVAPGPISPGAEPPCPGRSQRTTRCAADSSGATLSHRAYDVPSEGPRSSGGAETGPSARWLRRMPVNVAPGHGR